MGFVDIIVLVAAVASILSFIGVTIWKKKTGRSNGCGCDCDGCSYSSCPSAKITQERNEGENSYKENVSVSK